MNKKETKTKDCKAAPDPEAMKNTLLRAFTGENSSIDISSLKLQMQQSYREAKSAVHEQKLVENKKKRALIKVRKIQKEKEKNEKHKMMTRSLINAAMLKPRPVDRERAAMVQLYNVCKCLQCGEIKPPSEFYKSKSNSTGLQTSCTDCAYERFNRNPRENFIQHMYSHCKSRAKSKNFEFNLAKQDLHDLYDKQHGRCALSNREMTFIYKRGKREYIRHPTNVSLDRINPKGGYTKDNIQLTTNLCNHSKMDLMEVDFITMCQQVSDHHKHKEQERQEDDLFEQIMNHVKSTKHN